MFGIHTSGTAGSKVQRWKSPWKGFDVEFWAEDGVIYFVSDRKGDGEERYCLPEEFLQRVGYFGKLYDRIRRDPERHADELRQIERLLVMMLEAYNAARHQGTPTSPAVLAARSQESIQVSMVKRGDLYVPKPAPKPVTDAYITARLDVPDSLLPTPGGTTDGA